MTKVLRWVIAVLVCISFTGCGRESPSAEAAAEAKAKRERHCQDHICEGDIVPQYDPKTEAVLKLNNQFFIGPSEYFSNGIPSSGFYWPSKFPFSKAPPELVQSGPGRLSNFPDVAIEVFFRSMPSHQSKAASRYQELQHAEIDGRLISKKELRPGLEIWRVKARDGLRDGVWYVATKLKGADGYPPAGAPPVLWCDQSDPKYDRCTTGFWWQPGITVDMRFRAKHGPSWPEIFQETVRVLSLLRKA